MNPTSNAPVPRLTERFIEGLHRCEEEGASAIHDFVAENFHERCELRNPTVGHSASGLEGARRFWADYLSSFESVSSRFERAIDHEGLAVLEWVSDARLHSGRSFVYPGVSVLEFSDGKITRFCTYYDSAAFLRPASAGGTRKAA